jgi:hypothetical protein
MEKLVIRHIRVNRLRRYLLVLVMPLVACSGPGYGWMPPFEEHMNGLVGKSFSSSNIYALDMFVLSMENDSSRVYSTRMQNGCSYAFTVEKKSNTISGWFYISDPAPCRVRQYRVGA